VSFDLATVADLMLRGGAILSMALLAALLLRDYRHVTAARLGALFAIGSAAYTFCSAPQLHVWLGLWIVPALALASGNNLVFWLFSRSLFDDGFQPRRWHGALWAVMVGLAVIRAVMLEPRYSGAALIVNIVLSLQAIGFSLLACAQTIESWRGDLVERRRRLRVFIVAAAAIHSVASTIAGMATNGAPTPLMSFVSALALLLVAAAVAWSLLRASADEIFTLPAAADVPGPHALTLAEQRLVQALQSRMTTERFYRREGLTIAQLAQLQGLPEYRLRRLINAGLKFRNFNAFLNHYRIAEAKESLADTAQADVPILTIALDAGFSSLGPFNRAFKADTGLTPSEYRRAALDRLPITQDKPPMQVPVHEFG
jgi:AraC-like DNA-binding protein